MPLTIIKGPPNSGRTGQIRRRYVELLPRNPVLVVPGVDDIFGWERRLTDSTKALIGGQILHFKDLYSEILGLTRTGRPEMATELQRLHLVRQAIGSEWKPAAERIRDQPGLVQSVLDLIDDFRAENLDPETLAATVERDNLHHLRHLVEVYREYIRLLSGDTDSADGHRSGGGKALTDGPNEARLAIAKLTPELWKSRPLMIAGFDELTRQQLELVRRMAFDVGTEVTIAVTHEPENPALALTDRLVADLNQLRPEGAGSESPTRRGDVSRPHDPLLLEIEKRFMRPRRPEDKPLKASEALTVMRSTGARNEAEAIGLEVARLVADGVSPDQIGIAVEVPRQNGPVIRDTLERFGIPVTLEAETLARSTVTGQTLLNLLKASGPADSVESLLAFLRSPAGPRPDVVDELERAVRIDGIESARQAIELLTREMEEPPPPFWGALCAALAEKQPVTELAGEIALEIGLAVLAADSAPVPTSSTTIETRTVAAITRACLEIGTIHGAAGQPAAIAEALESDVIKVWAVPANGTVRIASPYSLRAKRLEYLFCASLQESGLTDTERAGPFLSTRERGELGMSPRRDPEDQQRYLFYSSISVPTKRLWLSCRTSDETGKTEHPSPLIAAVEELFAKDEDGQPIVARGGRTAGEITFQPADAPTGIELARGLAAEDHRDASLKDPGIDAGVAEFVRTRLDQAAKAEIRSRSLDSLSDSLVNAVVNDDRLTKYPKFSATEIEAYAGCPYRWFVDRQLDPQPFEPDPDYLATGSLLHNVLEDLYRGHDGEIPRPDTLSLWRSEVGPLVAKHASSARIGLGGDSSGHRVLRNRVEQLITTQLEREAAWSPAPRHLPALLEARFGTRHAEAGSLRVGDWALKGKIDRIDLSPETPTSLRREAVVLDYKTGSVKGLTWKKARKDRRLQVQLYLHAARDRFGVNPVAGLYVPLRTDGEETRGAFAEAVSDEMKVRGVPRGEMLEELDDFISDGVELADEMVGRMLQGILEHDPATCPNHLHHPAVQNRRVWASDTARGEDIR